MAEQSFGELQVISPVEKVVPTADKTAVVEPKGTIAHDDLQIFIRERTLSEIVEYSSSDVMKELGGVLVGKLYGYRGKPYIEVGGYIRAKHTVPTAASLKFTHATWEDIHREIDDRYPEMIVVGWQHTHPGYGIFLSHMDMFIQKNFFTQPWQVALVVDPKAENLGFFQWKEGAIAPCGFYFLR